MVKIVKDIWILTESGLVVYNRVIDPNLNPQIFGAFMSAFNSVSENFFEGGISNFELRNIRFTIVKRNHFLFVATSSNNVKYKKILNELNIISKKFFITYSEQVLKDWNSNIKVFSDFKNYIENSLEEITNEI